MNNMISCIDKINHYAKSTSNGIEKVNTNTTMINEKAHSILSEMDVSKSQADELINSVSNLKIN